MAGAPMIVSTGNLPQAMQSAQLPMGERVLNAELQGIRSQAAAAREGTAQIGAALQQGQAIVQRAQQGVVEAASSLVYTIAGGVRTAQRMEQTTAYRVGLDQLEQDVRDNVEYGDAAKVFSERKQQLYDSTIGKLWGPDQQAAQSDTLTTTLAVQKRISAHVAEKSGAAADAAYQAALPSQMQRTADAGSPQERQNLVAEHNSSIDQMVEAGHLDAVKGQQRKRAFERNVEITDAMRLQVKDPAALLGQLNDPERFKNLTPEERQAYVQSAQAAQDQRQTLRAGEAAKADPVAASATYSLRFPREMIAGVVDKALIPGESGGNAAAQSHKGAAGLTQFMPDTARAVASQMGLKVFDGLDDAGVREALKADPALARRMAIKHLGDLTQKFEGRLAPAFAAYHAGEGVAQTYHQKALAQFGPEYTPAQFASLIPPSINDGGPNARGTTTSDYVLGMFRRLGADPGRGGVSVTGAYRTAAAVDGVLQEQRSTSMAVVKDLITEQGGQRSALAQMYQDGFAADPAAVQRIRAPLEFAASQGDGSARQELRKLDEYAATAPLVAQAYQSGAQGREEVLAVLRAQVASGSATPEDQRRLSVIEAVHGKASEMQRSDPIRLLEREQSAPVTALPDPQAAMGPAFSAAVMARAQVASQANQRYGSSDMLRPAEAEAYKQAWRSMAPQQQAALLGSVQDAVATAKLPNGDALVQGFAKQVAGDSAAVRVAAHVGGRDPMLARDILNGQAVLNTEGFATKKGDVVRAMQASLPSNLFPGAVMADITEAALAVYASERAGSSKLFEASDTGAMQKAVERVAGKSVNWNGAKALVPPDKERNLRDAWDAMDARSLGVTGVDIGFVRDHGQLKPAGLNDGRFFIMLPSNGGRAPLKGADGRDVVIEIDALYRSSQRGIAGKATDTLRMIEPFLPPTAMERRRQAAPGAAPEGYP